MILRLGVIGSRSFNDYKLLCNTLQEYKHYKLEIVSGGAKGADSLAKRYAEENLLPYKEFLPDWDSFGKQAGFIRNADIIANSDEVVAFWDKKSSGTANSIHLAGKKGIPVKIIHFEEEKLIKSNKELFNAWKNLAETIGWIGGIVQNDYLASKEDVLGWIQLVNNSFAKFKELASKTREYIK